MDRPTDHAGYWPIIASVNDATSKVTRSQAAIAKGDWIIPVIRGPIRAFRALARPLAAKWNQAASSSTTTVSPSSTVAKA